MEKLRSAVHIPQEIEPAGTANYPEIIKVLTNTPGRAIDTSTQIIKIDRSYNFYLLKNIGLDTGVDVAAKYYINGADLNKSPTNLFLPDQNSDNIKIPAEDRLFDPNTGAILPKELSVGIIAQFTNADTYPSPGNLARLLIEDSNYDAATAAFFLSKDRLHATFRTSKSPQLNKNGVEIAMNEMTSELTRLTEQEGLSKKGAKKIILKNAIDKYALKHFCGQLNNLRLYEGLPNEEIGN